MCLPRHPKGLAQDPPSALSKKPLTTLMDQYQVETLELTMTFSSSLHPDPLPSRCSVSSALKEQDFPGGPVVKNLPANAGDQGFDPWSGKISHAMETLNPSSTPTEPML